MGLLYHPCGLSVLFLVVVTFLSDYTHASPHSHLSLDTSKGKPAALEGGDGGASLTPLDMGSCLGVAEVFAEKVGTMDAIPKHPIKDGILTVCDATQHHHNRLSCCTDAMEESFVKLSEDFARKQMRASNSKLKSRIRQSLRVYLEHLEKSMEDSYNVTSSQLTNLLKIPKEAHGKALDTLFTKLQEFVKSSRYHNLQDIIHEFFANLFPSVYEHSVSNTARPRGSYDKFHQCLTNFHNDIRPFGDFPGQLAKKIKFAFLRAKAVVDTLKIMLNAINVAESVSVDRNCRKGLSKLQYCSMCSGYHRVKPCRGFCLNVMRGCFPNIAELSVDWDALVVAFENLNLALLRKNNVQEILGYFSGNVTNAVLHAMEDVPRIYDEVIRLCEDSTPTHAQSGSPKRFSTAKGLSPSPSHHISYTYGTLRKDVLNLIRTLDNSKGFLAILADGLCRVPDVFETVMTSDTCWNGTSIGRYTRTVPEATIISQAIGNKEVKVNLYPKHKLLEVKDTLKDQMRNLSLLFNEELMIGDESLGRGSGLGEYSEVVGDDEDFSAILSGSGSGDDQEEESTDSERDPQNNRLTPTKSTTQKVGEKNTGRDDGKDEIGKEGKNDKGGSYDISNNDQEEGGSGGGGSGVATYVSWGTLLSVFLVSQLLSRSFLSSRSHCSVL